MKEDKIHLHFVLDKTTNMVLIENAKQCGLNRTAYLRQLIRGTPVKALPPREVTELYREINAIGRNINQIAHSANAGIAPGKAAAQALFLLKKVYERLDEVIRG